MSHEKWRCTFLVALDAGDCDGVMDEKLSGVRNCCKGVSLEVSKLKQAKKISLHPRKFVYDFNIVVEAVLICECTLQNSSDCAVLSTMA